jgi:agmatine/peptidylarginine deiminase
MQWPGHWEKAYEPTFAKMSEIISRYEKLHILYGTEKIFDDARKAISDIGADPNNNINWHEVPNDNAWMRDNGPGHCIQIASCGSHSAGTRFKELLVSFECTFIPNVKNRNNVKKIQILLFNFLLS